MTQHPPTSVTSPLPAALDMCLEPKSGDVHGGNLKTRRKNTTKACEECRRRRAKCDGKQPACSRCFDRLLPCHYSTDEDRRRPAPKAYVDMLRNRISLLERVLEMHSVDVEAAISQLTVLDSSPDASAPIIDDKLWDRDSTLVLSTSKKSSTEDLRSSFEGALSLDESLNFDQDGEVHYFGPSSGRLEFHPTSYLPERCRVEARLKSDPPTPTRPGFGQSRARMNHRIVQDMQPSISPELEAHLIDLYFVWEQPWCQVVNEKLFRESRECNGRYCSTLLLYCILAAGSRSTDRPEVRTDPSDPKTAGQAFLEKAEMLLYYDLKWPSITTIQAASIMGTLYLSIGADAAGWLHHGIANRLALDMGLNMDAHFLDVMPLEESELRNQIYWSLYCVDKLMGSYIGRVCTLLDSQGVVEPPKHSRALRANSPGSGPSQRLATGDTIRTCLHIGLASVCRILEKILVTLYAPRSSDRAMHGSQFLNKCILELRSWFYDLPANLRIDRSGVINRFPQAYTLHMVYHTTHILLMKPFLSKLTSPPADDQNGNGKSQTKDTENNQNMTKQAISTCYKAAQSICDVARRYRAVFGTFRNSPLTAAHCILSAALILLQVSRGASNDNGRNNKTDHANLELCLRVLEEMSTAWSPARSILKNLHKLCTSSIQHMEPNHFEQGLPGGSDAGGNGGASNDSDNHIDDDRSHQHHRSYSHDGLPAPMEAHADFPVGNNGMVSGSNDDFAINFHEFGTMDFSQIPMFGGMVEGTNNSNEGGNGNGNRSNHQTSDDDDITPTTTSVMNTWMDHMMERSGFPDIGLDFMSESLPTDYTNFDDLNRHFH